MTYQTVEQERQAVETALLELKATVDDLSVTQDERDRAAAMLRVYAAAVKYSLKNGETEESADGFGRLHITLHHLMRHSDLAGLAKAEAEFTQGKH